MTNTQAPVALITGAARRIGAAIASMLHSKGYRIIIHYHHSATEAEALCAQFNRTRKNSAHTLQANLMDTDSVQKLAHHSIARWGQVNTLVNNASSFYPTPLASANENQWDDLIGSNVKGPYFLCQALGETLKKQRGSIVNIADIHAQQPLKNHTIYCIAKAGNRMLTRAIAQELAPAVRVNGIAPGVILWPEKKSENNEENKINLIKTIPLQRMGSSEDVANVAAFLITDAHYISGQIISVDGGKHLNGSD